MFENDFGKIMRKMTFLLLNVPFLFLLGCGTASITSQMKDSAELAAEEMSELVTTELPVVVALVPFKADSGSAAVADVYFNQLIHQLNASKRFVVLDRGQTANVQAEKLLSESELYGTKKDPSAGLPQSESLISGTVKKLGRVYVISLTWVRSDTGKLLYQTQFEVNE